MGQPISPTPPRDVSPRTWRRRTTATRDANSVRFHPEYCETSVTEPLPHEITSVDELRAVLGEPRPAQLTKCLTRLDDHCRRWIASSPFVVICSADASGRMDVSPKGDPPGFVQALDDTTLVVPDRPGNKRFDTFANILENPRVAIVFLVPGRDETLRVGGTASISTDPDLLATMEVQGRPPRLALVVHVDEAMFHCGKSMIRSGLWEPDRWPEVDHLASYAECLADQARPDETVEEMEIRFATWRDGNEMY